jgi:antitoxin component of MazEF toxin-antitoxin module
MEISKIYKHGGSLVVVVPREILKVYKLENGDQLVFLRRQKDETIRLRKLPAMNGKRAEYEQTEE